MLNRRPLVFVNNLKTSLANARNPPPRQPLSIAATSQQSMHGLQKVTNATSE